MILSEPQSPSLRESTTVTRAEEDETMESLTSSLRLPDNAWSVTEKAKGFHLRRVVVTSEETGQSAVLHSVMIGADRTWKVCCYDNPLPADCGILHSLPAEASSDVINEILKRLDTSTFCLGNNDEKFVAFAESKKGKFYSIDGKTVVAHLTPSFRDGNDSQTVRSPSCSILIDHTTKTRDHTKVSERCSHCSKYRNTLFRAFGRYREKMTTERSVPLSSNDSRANVRYLNTPERSLRFKQLKSRATAAERKLKKLVADRLESDGVSLKDDMQEEC